MRPDEERLDESWRANAEAWTRSVREGRIESRRAVTDRAVQEAVLRDRPARVLDVGCGEGWLARALAARGVEVVGFDGSPELIASAREAAGARFHALGYAAFAADPLQLGTGFDAAVCNFSLLSETVGPVLGGCRTALADGGRLVIQTLHPAFGCGDLPYEDGWREERFDGMGAGYRSSMPWYFRTLASWIAEVRAADFELVGCEEPVHPATGRPASLLLIGRPAR